MKSLPYTRIEGAAGVLPPTRKEIKMIFYKIFLEHPNDTDNPQGYWAHGKFSVTNSLKGIVYMLAGIVHGIFPILFPFTTSSWIIRSFVKLVESERHKDELKKYVSQTLVRQLRRDTKDYR